MSREADASRFSVSMGAVGFGLPPLCFALHPAAEKLPFTWVVLLAESPLVWEHTISDQRYTDEEFALILRKAGELHDHPSGERAGDLTLEEMKAAAREVGIDPALIERAAALVPRTEPQTNFERVIGGRVKYALDKTVTRALSEEQIERLVPVIREASRKFGVIEADPSGLAWRSGSEPSQIFVTATREGDETRLRVTTDRGGELVLTSFLGVLGGLIPAMIVGASLDPASFAVGAGIVATGLAGGLTIARTAWAKSTRKLGEQVDGIMDGMTRAMERDD